MTNEASDPFPSHSLREVITLLPYLAASPKSLLKSNDTTQKPQQKGGKSCQTPLVHFKRWSGETYDVWGKCRATNYVSQTKQMAYDVTAEGARKPKGKTPLDPHTWPTTVRPCPRETQLSHSEYRPPAGTHRHPKKDRPTVNGTKPHSRSAPVVGDLDSRGHVYHSKSSTGVYDDAYTPYRRFRRRRPMQAHASARHRPLRMRSVVP